MTGKLIHLAAASLVVAAGALGVSSTASAKTAAAKLDCGKQVTMLFWPSGNPELGTIGQPKVAVAHLDLYRGFAPTYPLDHFLGWAAAGKFPASTPSPYTNPYCFPYTTIGKPSPIASPTKITRAARVVCSFPRSVLIQIDTLGKFHYRVRIVMKPATLVAEGIVAPKGSTLTYAGRNCTRKTSPA